MKSRIFMYTLGGGALLITLYVLAMFFPHAPSNWTEGMDVGGDLKQFYAAGTGLRDHDYHYLYRNFEFGRELYLRFEKEAYDQGLGLEDFNFRYSPLLAWISKAALAIPYPAWITSWFVFSLLAIIAGAVLLRISLGRDCQLPAWTWFYFFGYPPLLYGLLISQNSCLTFLILASAMLLIREKQLLAAGMVLSCAFYKPQLVVVLGGFLFLCGQFRMAIGAAIGTAFWVIASLVACGWESHVYWYESLSEIMKGIQSDEMATNIPWKGFLLTCLPSAWEPQVLVASDIIGLAGLAATLWFVWKGKKSPFWTPEMTLSAGITYWMIFTPHVKSYEMILGMFWLLHYLNLKERELPRMAWTVFFWLCGALAISARMTQLSQVAPLLTLWFFWTLHDTIRLRPVKA